MMITAKQVHLFEGHQSFVKQLAFFPDGRKLVSRGWEGTALIWAVQPPGLAAARRAARDCVPRLTGN
jgi:hypothetical protein